MDRYLLFCRLAGVATVFALVVVMLGAYVRLSNAGLGCPDWPGCYGHLTVPESTHAMSQATKTYPGRPVEPAKAWKEMVHRYFAGTLGLIIAALLFISLTLRRVNAAGRYLPMALVVLVIFQALLGMWTVTLLLKPLIVMGHLLGGFATLALLWWLFLSQRFPDLRASLRAVRMRTWVLLGLVILIAQIALGGWTSSNYAALACTDFPTCQGQWWPHMDFRDAFVLWRGIGINYEYGVLTNPARTAIHVTHRIGALITITYLALLALRCVIFTRGWTFVAGWAVLVLVITQFSLGVSNVVFHLPLPVAVAHNGTAALLLLSVLALLYGVTRPAEEKGGES
ncbi:MAG: COX15/CtaA family protein [Gammaproteobacteria bacterium]|jgi:heme a synthase